MFDPPAKRPTVRSIWLTALFSAGLVLSTSLLWAAADPQVDLPGAQPVPPKPPAERVLYPPRHRPTLALPDGRRREVASLLNVDRRLRYGDFIWNEGGVPAGPVWVRVDLRGQIMSVFRGGHEIGTTVVLYGTDGHPTPTGIFPVLQKAERHRSSLYDAEMPYMLRLTGDGVAIHASNIVAGSATHGCVGVPREFARRLFGQVKRGDQVVIVAG